MATPDRDRLLELAQAQGVSLSALSRMLGKNAAYLQQFVRRGTPRKLEEGDRGRLARFFGVAEAELGAAQETSSSVAAGAGGQAWLDIPRLAVGASAGPGALAAGAEEVVGAVRFAESWLRGLGLRPASLSAIAVQGDSMEPTLRDGDEILVDCAMRQVCDGVHVVRIGDALLVKRLATEPGGRIVLLSDNPAYRPVECDAAEVQVIGRVVWKGGRL